MVRPSRLANILTLELLCTTTKQTMRLTPFGGEGRFTETHTHMHDVNYSFVQNISVIND